MSSQEFVFKQFTILQDKCAMKVGTDAVLLGSWVTTSGAKTILDIGTGTGIIALMLAQKSDAVVDAIDIDNNAYLQAIQNISNCKWKNRIHVHHTSIQQFAAIQNHKYDLIVSNPPYFVDSSKAIEESRTNARHTDQLPFDDLLNGVLNLLNTEGKFYVILPTKESQGFREMAEKQNLFLTKLTRVITRTDKPEKRLLMKFEFIKKEVIEDSIVIENEGRHCYTDEYIELTKDYYLGF
jgi:tRNA1Val (adenine37-N6)-methyltransferase